MKAKKITIKSSVILFLVLLFAVNVIDLNLINNLGESNNQTEIYSSADESFQEQWISNPNFVSSENWTSIKGAFGDPNDINTYIGGGSANYEVLGDSGTYSLTGIPNSTWTAFPNYDWGVFMQEGTEQGIDSDGCWVDYLWDEQTDQTGSTPSVHWKKNITLPFDMSDYKISSASLEVIFNATVQVSPVGGGGIDCPGDTGTLQVGDYAKFYVLISDIEDVYQPFQVAYNRTRDLGKDSTNTDTIDDKPMEPINETLLMNYLELVLGVNSTTFGMTLGIDLYCEDNDPSYDEDSWEDLRIKYYNLTFTYEKKINQQTSASWNQDGNKISDRITISPYTSFEVNEAILKFYYKINDTWISASPNSEIRIFMNNIKHTETIKLSTATPFFQNASTDGFNLKSLISDDVNLSIQVFLADEFELDKGITISITNLSLDISYTVIFDDYQTNLQLFLNGDPQTSITVHKDQMLNITIKYTNQTGGHITGANIQLSGEGIIETLNETTNQYTTIINVTEELNLEKWNDLNIEATKLNYQTKLVNPSIYVRKLWGEIKTFSGNKTFNIASGDAFQLQIILNDTDNNELIKGATVQYWWDLDPIPRILTEDNGVYEGFVRFEGENPPDGLYTINIEVVGGVGDDFDFEHLHPPDGTYSITLNVGSYVPSPEPSTDLSWLVYLLIFGLTGAILGFAIIFSLYIKYWRFPPLVRKIRGLRKKVSKAKKTKPVMVNTREEIIKNNMQDNLKILSLEVIQPEKIDKTKIKKEDVN